MPILCFCKSLKLLIDSGLECFKFLFVSSPLGVAESADSTDNCCPVAWWANLPFRGGGQK
jgi:hypothetical protein